MGLVVLLVGTAVLYLWNITINGMGNQFYAAAAQAGSTNWEALLFGSLDAAQLHHRRQAAAVAVGDGALRAAVRLQQRQHADPAGADGGRPPSRCCTARSRGSAARAPGLLAGAALALTPVAVLMFRFNNPDAAMVLLMTAAAYCTVRALERRAPRWLAWAGVALGFAFLAKMLEGVMVMPALAAAYLLAAPMPLRRPAAAPAGWRPSRSSSRRAGSWC